VGPHVDRDTPRKHAEGWKTALILPDPQIGFRRFDDGTLDPFHDEQAIAVALRIIGTLVPDVIVNLGDLLDLAEWSRFEQEPAFASTTQAALDRAHLFLAEQRAAAPGADIRLLEGNHDRRIYKAVVNNAKAAFGLRQAASPPESWPVLSVPHLLRLDELGVEYVGGYPAGITWVNDNLACIHGHKVRSAGSTAAAVVDDERVSVIFGHVHRIELLHKTRQTRSGPKHSLAATPGCLSRIDGAVPSTKGSTDPWGKPLTSWENWTQGIAVVSYMEGDGPFALELVPIFHGQAVFRGEVFDA
jgi:predicted phosphodiesterase